VPSKTPKAREQGTNEQPQPHSNLKEQSYVGVRGSRCSQETFVQRITPGLCRSQPSSSFLLEMSSELIRGLREVSPGLFRR
jgi:hypothetical protein